MFMAPLRNQHSWSCSHMTEILGDRTFAAVPGLAVNLTHRADRTLRRPCMIGVRLIAARVAHDSVRISRRPLQPVAA
jgi:hypothetical protein